MSWDCSLRYQAARREVIPPSMGQFCKEKAGYAVQREVAGSREWTVQHLGWVVDSHPSGPSVTQEYEMIS